MLCFFINITVPKCYKLLQREEKNHKVELSSYRYARCCVNRWLDQSLVLSMIDYQMMRRSFCDFCIQS